jgi:hypothetical protein
VAALCYCSDEEHQQGPDAMSSAHGVHMPAVAVCSAGKAYMHARSCSTAAHINAVHLVVNLVLAKLADDQILARNA